MFKNIQQTLLLITGPPGCGKTTLASSLDNFIRNKPKFSSVGNDVNIQSILISYDTIIDKKIENQLISNHENNAWKSGRKFVSQLVKTLVEYLRDQNGLLLSSYFKEKIGSDYSENEVSSLIFENFIETLSELDARNNSDQSVHYFIILDDIFYYESMRHVYFKLAKESETSFFTFCLKPDRIDLLIDRNSTRDPSQRLDFKIVKNIYDKFEYPNDIDWEKRFSFVQAADQSTSINNEEYLNTIINLALKNHECFLLKIEEDKRIYEQKLSAIDQKNLHHECDKILRKLIGFKLTTDNITNKAEVARKLNSNRVNILTEIKNRQTDLANKLEKQFLRENYLELIEIELKNKLFSI